jgi:hypothetical protein
MDESRRCTAHSSQTGEPCKKAAIRGGTVCASHGGQAPQVKKTARERLEALIDPAIDALRDVLQRGLDIGETPSAVRAALGILDRCGFHPSQCVELTGEGGGPVEVARLNHHLDCLSVEEKETLVELLERVGISCGSEGGRS